MKPRAHVLLAIALVLAFLVQCLAFVRANSQTYDEGVTLVSGSLLLRHGPEVNGEHPPLARVIAALPMHLLLHPTIDLERWRVRRESAFALGQDFLYESGSSHEDLLQLGRAPMVAGAVLLVALIGLFAWRLFGPRAGLLALFLAAFDPNLVAHGSIASHDGLLTLFTTLTMFCVAELFARPRLLTLLFAGIALGLCLLTKFSGIAVIGLILAAFALHAARSGSTIAWMSEEEPPPRLRALAYTVVSVTFLFLIAYIVVRAMYGGRGIGAYVGGVRAQLAHQEYGHRAFFLGEVGTRGWTAYFPVALLLKAPPLTLVLAAISIVRFRRGTPLGHAWTTAVVPAALFLFATLFARTDIGVRYVLPIVPLLIVAASRVATFDVPRQTFRFVAALALLHHFVAAVRIAPHDLAFFSDVFGGSARGDRYLSDSNLDWGQDLRTLAEWNRENKPARLSLAYFGTASIDAHGIAYELAPNGCLHPSPYHSRPFAPDGRGSYLAVSAVNAQGVFFDDPEAYRWLEDRVPVARLGWSIAVYDITHDAAAHRELARLYARYGPADLAGVANARADAIDRGATP